jgi:hypothetical protein
VNTAAPKDGTVIGTFSPGLVLEHAMGTRPGAFQFDPALYPWLGSPTVSTNMCMVATRTGVNNLDQLLASPREIVFGSTAPASMSTSAAPTLMRHYLNAPIKVVQGFDGIATIKLAVEREEVDATCGTWEAFRSSHAEWLRGDPPFARVVLKSREDPLGELRDVPELGPRFATEEARRVYGVATAPDAVGFTYAAPPGVPEARLKALRAGLVAAWSSPDFKAEAERAMLVARPQDYRTVSGLFRQITDMPPQLLDRAAEVLGLK